MRAFQPFALSSSLPSGCVLAIFYPFSTPHASSPASSIRENAARVRWYRRRSIGRPHAGGRVGARAARLANGAAKSLLDGDLSFTSTTRPLCKCERQREGENMASERFLTLIGIFPYAQRSLRQPLATRQPLSLARSHVLLAYQVGRGRQLPPSSASLASGFGSALGFLTEWIFCGANRRTFSRWKRRTKKERSP